MSTSEPEPPVGNDDAVLLQLLAEKSISLGDQVTSLFPRMENFLGVAIAILVGALTLGLTRSHPLILVLLPFPVVLLYVFLLQVNTEMLSRAGHKRFLEEQVNTMLQLRGNRLAQRRVMLEESDVAVTLQGWLPIGRGSLVLMQALMLVLLAGTSWLAVAHLTAIRGHGWRIVVCAGLAVGIAMLGKAAWEQGGAYKRGYEAARAGFQGGPEPESPLMDPWSRLRGFLSPLRK